MHHETHLTNICTCGDNIFECGHARRQASATPDNRNPAEPPITLSGEVRGGRQVGTLVATLATRTLASGIRAVKALEAAGWTASEYRGEITIKSSPKGPVGPLRPDYEFQKAAVRAIMEAA